MTSVKQLGLFAALALILVATVAGHDCDWNQPAWRRLHWPRCWPQHIPSRGYDRVGARIPYWTTTFPDCMNYCKNDIICVDYCSFRFGINPNLPGTNVTLITKWDYPFPIFVNGTWFYSGRTHKPYRPYPHYPHQGYPHYPQILPENHTHPHYYPYPHHGHHLYPRQQPCYPYPSACHRYKPEWCLKQVKPYSRNYYKPCYKPRYLPRYINQDWARPGSEEFDDIIFAPDHFPFKDKK